MSEQKVNPSRFRWLILTTILAVAVISVAIAFWTGIFFPRKVEKIYFGSSQWSEDPSSGDITEANLYIANTGADELIINKVWINGTLLDSTEWESFPSMRFQPGDQGVLQITPSLIIFKEGTTYHFTIQTVAGNSFSYTAVAESDLDFTFLKTEELKITALSWGANNANATLTVKNTGTGALTISSVKVNDGSATMSPSSVTLQPGEQTTIVVNITGGFTSGTKYEFAFYTATGNRYPYTSTAP